MKSLKKFIDKLKKNKKNKSNITDLYFSNIDKNIDYTTLIAKIYLDSK